ncbi:MAG: M50 family metallopeptidase [Thermus sp.]|uniref:M50 family metallopeptidase n=1 Tax=unclassified Thermus TaxID=2619321 RepID=UPI00059DABAA|nr:MULTISPECIES: M50 family metallopeptidase [unclassified Thermus]MCS6869809.1 M50 family metallopeptidase [Thermus sp.]MCS7217685.1 M50 family metallopeptidase [Thermus sp.]MCX7849177.1 M50 family metallopeptidase [Thermus sp.]MDW8016205.1 M50 family metallopeptidase [Thermus sp.]MDW8356781.1 M50 family metallopeptidase [Thermus sp.]
MSLLWFLIIIGVSVFVHELGHYLAARVQGVRVKAFSVGFGPVLWRRQAWGTEWRLSAIPLGGYADIEGLLPEERGRGYDALPFPGKLLIMVAGVAMNILLAWGLLAYLFSAQGVPEATGRAVILEVLPGSVAEAAGLRAGDILLAVDGKPLSTPQEIERVKTPGEHTLTLRRGAEEVSLRLAWREGMERLGVVYQPEVAYRKVGFGEGLALAASRTLAFGPQMVKALVGGLFGVLTGNPNSGVMGPVGIVAETGRAAQEGLFRLVELAAAINLSLALFNLLPIPALDGGRILLLFLSRLVRIRPEQEAMVHYLGFLFLIFLVLLVTFQDLRRLLGG